MSLDNLNWTIEYYEGNIQECNSLLNEIQNYDKIPLLNYVPLRNFSDGALIRYRGMVQDMLNPEYYSPSYTVINTQSKQSYTLSGKYRDIPVCKANEEFKSNEEEIVPKERQVFFCIPLPGCNKWVESYLNDQNKCTLNMGQSSGMKRRTSDSGDEMEVSENVTDSTSPKKVKKNKTTEEGQTSPSNTYNLANYFPFNEENGVACLIKTYEDTEKHGLVLNDVVEVVGFLSLNPALEATWEDTDTEDKATHPPPSLVPRIHAIAIKKLKHCNPLLQQNILYDNILEQAEAARSDLLLIFTQLLFEDSIAAEYLLCHLLSRVYIRNEGHTIGKFSLNLYNVKHNMFGSYVSNILQMLVTHSHYLPLSIELLNDSCFTPKKDYESNRLWSAVLQLPDDTLLILDETSMSEGQLKNQGCLNVLALQRLFRDQEIQYDFGYYPVTYNTNIQLLVISEGKSMFDADIKLNMRSNSVSQETLTESYEAVRIYLTEEVTNKLRNYLTAVRLLDFELGEDMVKKIGEDYVTMRQQNEQVNSSDLHTLLVFSRLLALSHGRKHMIAEDWSRAVELETERKARSA